MDEITKKITETQSELVQTLNRSGLHPAILRLILEGILNQLLQVMAAEEHKSE